MWTPVIDVSRHQGVIDFDVMLGKGVTGLILRATHGRTPDDRCATYYHDAVNAGFAPEQIGFYSFINPKRGSAIATAEANAAIIFGITGRRDVLYMLDVESYRQEGPNVGTVTLTGRPFADYLLEHWERFEAQMPGCRVIAYSNAAFWDSPDGPRDRVLAAELEWIVPRYPVYSSWGYARYPVPGVDGWPEWAFARKPEGPIPPAGATWSGWQFSAGFNGQGPVYGCGSTDLDLNIVKTEAWQRWTNTTPTPPPAIPEEDDMPVYAIKPRDPKFGGALFTTDGHPLSLEFAESGAQLVIIDQDHAHWDAATWAKLGPEARKLYDPTYVEPSVPATVDPPSVTEIADELARRLEE